MFHWIKKYIPSRQELEQNKSLQSIRRWFGQPLLWKFDVNTVSKGVAVGLFVNFIPLPLQMIMAALLSIPFRANLPIAVAISWINNPFTFLAINFLTYKVGAWIIQKEDHVSMTTTWHWDFSSLEGFWNSFLPWFSQFGKAYLIGFFILSLSMAFLGYWIVQIVWKLIFWKGKKKKGSSSR